MFRIDKYRGRRVDRDDSGAGGGEMTEGLRMGTGLPPGMLDIF